MKAQLIALLLFAPLFANASNIHYTGRAYDIKSGKLHYIEKYHEVYNSNNQLISATVNYYSSKQELIATKKLDYSNNLYAPQFYYYNIITGYKESLNWLDEKSIELKSADESGTQQSKRLDINSQKQAVHYVADAGFDTFLRQNLNKLISGDDLSFRFINPARLTWYSFYARSISKKPNSIVIEVGPKNPIVRFLAPPIILTYSLNDSSLLGKRLQQYSGLTNMSFDNENYVVANIKYQYFDPNKSVVNMF